MSGQVIIDDSESLMASMGLTADQLARLLSKRRRFVAAQCEAHCNAHCYDHTQRP